MMAYDWAINGHCFDFANPMAGALGVRQGKSLSVIFDADNPGLWAAHCHSTHHAETGMMTILGYQAF